MVFGVGASDKKAVSSKRSHQEYSIGIGSIEFHGCSESRDQQDTPEFFQMSTDAKKVIILLATLNGEEFLPEQLQSYRDQTHANWELLVSDDGSTDRTVALIKAFAKLVPQRVTLREGRSEGFWKNFLSMVHLSDVDGEFFAYSDQDDIWGTDKLARAIDWLAGVPKDLPAVYFTRTALISSEGRPLGYSPLFRRPSTFQNALVQNIGGGNTMVFNRAAKLALAAIPEDVAVTSHDWWTYQVVTGIGGTAYFDPYPSLKYRQHEGNLVGANMGLHQRVVRLRAFAHGRVMIWNDINIKALNEIRHLLTPSNLATLDQFTLARKSTLPKRLSLLWRSGVYRQNALDNFGIFLGSIFRKI
jgi:glycosyltransferase involved in cell wall biosynthesis